MRPLFRRMVWGVVMLIASELAIGGEAPPVERRLPASTLQFAVLRNVPELRRRLIRLSPHSGGSSDSKAVRAPDGANRDLLEEFAGSEKMLLYDTTDKESPVRPARWRPDVRGEAAVALVRDTSDDLSLIWLVDFGDSVADVAARTDWMASWIPAEENRRKEIKVGDFAATWIDLPKAELARHDVKHLVFLVMDTYLVVSTSKGALAMVLERWDGKQQDTLEHDASFDRTREGCRSNQNGAEAEVIWFRRGDRWPQSTDPFSFDVGWFPGKFVMDILDSRFDLTEHRFGLPGECHCEGGGLVVPHGDKRVVIRRTIILNRN